MHLDIFTSIIILINSKASTCSVEISNESKEPVAASASVSGDEEQSCYSRERISEDFIRNTLHSFEEDQETLADSETTTSTLQGDSINMYKLVL